MDSNILEENINDELVMNSEDDKDLEISEKILDDEKIEIPKNLEIDDDEEENPYGIEESDDIETKITKIIDGIEDEGLSFIRIIDTEKVTIIITEDENVGKLIGRGGKNVKILSHQLQKRVRIMAEHLDFESIAKNILSPARISTISTVYAKNGQKNKIRVLKQDTDKIPGNLNSLSNVIQELSNKEVVVVVE